MSPIVDQLRADYDKFPYLSGSFPASHPDNLQTVAALAGFSSAPTTNCRVLEVGCAAGRNLLPMAQLLPQSRFLGIDLSARQIELASAAARQVGLTNVEFRCQDILEFGSSEGPFDYIVAHGIYSWVPPDVRERLMQICGLALTANGLAYISYNTLPGWHVKRIGSEIMRFHTRGLTDPQQRIAAAKEAMIFIAQESTGTPGYKDAAGRMKEVLLRSSDEAFLHDLMEAVNDPVYFVDFISHASKYGLTYVSAAAPQPEYYGLPTELKQQIIQLSADEVVREQYLDFLFGRVYRASVLCRSDANWSRGPELAALPKLHAASICKLENPIQSATGDPVQATVAKDGATVVLRNPMQVNIMRQVLSAWPQSIPVDEWAQSQEALQFILAMYDTGMMELRTRPANFISTAERSFLTTPLARWQAASGNPIVNLRHEMLAENTPLRRLLPMLDGTRNYDALLRLFHRMIETEELVINRPNGRVSPNDDLGPVLQQLVKLMARLSLLCNDSKI